MNKTIALVTNQYRCDRIINSGAVVAKNNESELIVVCIMDSEYNLDPPAIDYLFDKSKQVGAVMRILFTDDKAKMLKSIVAEHNTSHILTGMPNSPDSVIYELWNDFPNKKFYTIELDGTLNGVATKKSAKKLKSAI